MTRLQRLSLRSPAVLVVASVIFLACAGPQRRAQPTPLILEDDTSLFSLVVRTAVTEAGIPLRVDPRPFVADPTVSEVNELFRAMAPAALVASRADVLRRLGVERTDDATRGRCPGVLVPPMPGDGPERSKAVLCPKERVAVAAFGLPRRGGAFMPSTGVNERVSGAERGEWAIRVLLTRLGPSGAATTVYDFVVRQDQEKWVLVKAAPLLFVD